MVHFSFKLLCVYNFRTHDSDNDLLDLDKRSRRDRDGESSKGKKKHKKHKKNKKSKKYDADGKEKHSSKKHKKHHKRSKSNDGGCSSDSNTDIATVKMRSDTASSSSRHEIETKLAPQTTSTLNTKFTEIMKSNGHVVVAKAPTVTKYNGNGAAALKRDSSTSKIPTDPSKLVEFITKSLDPNTSTQVVSSASDSDTVRDVDSPDVAVIEEDDLNLEELMRQKALLQARLGGIAMSDTESENSRKTPLSSSMAAAVITVNKTTADDKDNDKTKLKRTAELSNDIILLDDSSNEASEKPSPPKKKPRSSRSRSRDRTYKDRTSGNNRNNRDSNRDSRDNRDNRENNRDNDKSSKTRRSDVENRFKEDLRREIDRDKERSRSSPKRQSSSTLKTGTYSPNSKSRISVTERNKPTQSTQSSSTTSTSVQREREVN